MKSFETYVLQHKVKNFQAGNKVKYIGSDPRINPNTIYTFLELKEVYSNLYITVEEHSDIFIHPNNIIKA